LRGLILAADGDPAYARNLRKILTSVSVTPDDVVVVTDGGQVLDRLRTPKRRPCVVLLDAWLPEWPGLDVLEWIRRRRGLRTLPVVLMSAGEDPTLMRHAARLRANAFLVKPYGPPAMTRILSAFAYAWRLRESGRRPG
jgi:CheY-like chemotaxis protein